MKTTLTSLWVRRASENDLPKQGFRGQKPLIPIEGDVIDPSREDFYSPANVHRNHVRLNYVSRECAACQEGIGL